MNVGVVGNPRYDGLSAVLRTVADTAARHNVTLFTEEGLEAVWSPPPRRLSPDAQLDALLTFGGDGTLLRGARLLEARSVPILGINLGRVGFLTSATVEETEQALEFLFTGRYEETAFHAVGSGSLFARGALKKLYREDLDEDGCVTAVVQALYDAADDDSATGGPDLTRRIFPVVGSITAAGYRRLPDSEVAAIADRMIAGRMERPDGPAAPLT